MLTTADNHLVGLQADPGCHDSAGSKEDERAETGCVPTTGADAEVSARTASGCMTHARSGATFVAVAMEATVAGHGCRLVLRISAYELPDEVSGSDANWLTGEVELQAGLTGVFRARHSAALRTDELAQFRDQLKEVVASLNGTATMHHLESQVGCTIELASGRGNLSAFVREHVGSELHVRQCETDQSYLTQTLRELDAIVETFPVRGTPT